VTNSTPSETTHPTLVVTGGPLDGSTFVILPQARPLGLGSASDCDIQLLLGNVEPTHATLDLGARGLLLSDCASATGTYVNGEKIAARHVLNDGDRVCLGPPGSKSSAKLLVRIPKSWAAPSEEDEGDEVVVDVDADADPLVLVKPAGESGLVAVPDKPAAPHPAPHPAPPPPPPPPPPPAPVAKKKLILRGVNFDFDKATLQPAGVPILQEAAKILKENPTVSVQVQGYTDAIGSVAYNLRLSDRRANTVKGFLVKEGVAASRLTTKGFGKSDPVATNETAEGRAQNRRVELVPQ